MRTIQAGKMVAVRRVVQRAAFYGWLIVTRAHPRYAVVSWIAALLPEFSAGPLIARLYRWAGFRIGAGSSFAGRVRIVVGRGRPDYLTLGKEVIVSSEVTINLDERVTIGDRVSLAPFVRIYTANHPVGPPSRRMRAEHTPRPVTVGDGAWLRLGVTVLPGVTIGAGSVIAAGSVVICDIAPNTFAAGNPAVPLKRLPSDEDSPNECTAPTPRPRRRITTGRRPILTDRSRPEVPKIDPTATL